jgi:hypothetical protein
MSATCSLGLADCASGARPGDGLPRMRLQLLRLHLYSADRVSCARIQGKSRDGSGRGSTSMSRVQNQRTRHLRAVKSPDSDHLAASLRGARYSSVSGRLSREPGVGRIASSAASLTRSSIAGLPRQGDPNLVMECEGYRHHREMSINYSLDRGTMRGAKTGEGKWRGGPFSFSHIRMIGDLICS